MKPNVIHLAPLKLMKIMVNANHAVLPATLAMVLMMLSNRIKYINYKIGITFKWTHNS